jgi:hypothetical protein
MQFCNGFNKGTASNIKSQKNVMETLPMKRPAFGEESMSCTWEFEWNAWFKTDGKR